MSVERYRHSAHELALFDQLCSIEQRLSMFSYELQRTLPTLNVSHLRECSRPCTFLKPTDIELAEGRGPRFVSKYNLARSDRERQALLDSLKVERPHSIAWELSTLLNEYRLWRRAPYGKTAILSFVMAQEWIDWHDGLKEKDAFKEVDSLSSAEAHFKYKWSHGDRVMMDNEVLHFKIRDNSKVEANVDWVGKEITLLPSPKAMAYVVLIHVGNAGVQDGGIIRWSEHELRWLTLPSTYLSTEHREEAIFPWLDSIGLPAYEPPKLESLLSTFEGAAEKLRTEWLLDLNHKQVEKRTIELQGVLRLEITPPYDGYYGGRHDYVAYVLDDPLDIEERVSFPFALNNYGDLYPAKSVVRLDDRDNRIINHLTAPSRQWGRLMDLVDRLVNAPIEDLVITDHLRENPYKTTD